MTEQEIQNFVVSTYNENIDYLKKSHPTLYENLSLFNMAIELNQIKNTFDLEYKDNYFDLVNLNTKEFFYNNNSLEISKNIVDSQVDFNPRNNSFKAFYEQNFSDEIAKLVLRKPIDEINAMGNAPIINYVNKNLPQIESLNEIYKYIFFGLGLGIHIPIIHERIKAKFYLIVEPSLEIFKLSLFVTNYSKLAQEAKIIFSIADNEFQFREKFDTLYCDSFIDNHYFKFFKLTDNCNIYMKTIQNFLISQSYYLYSYDRTFSSIFRTNTYITNKYKILNISKVLNLEFSKKPILLLAAGPSLQKNIKFVKQNQDKFIIIAIYATLPLLENNAIKPDIITQYDEQNHQVLNTLDKIKDISFFENSILLLASHVNEKLTKSFPKENIYIFQAMFELKKDFGTLTSPSIGELTYALALKLGAKEIYLLGLDLALDNETNKSHIDGHSGANAFNNLKDLENSSDTSYSYRKNTIVVKGNFLHEVKTLPVFKSNIDAFNLITQEYKTDETKTYNLSNGAYLNHTIPMKIESINSKDFLNLQKNENIKVYKEELNTYCEIDYSDSDLELINLKISAAKKFKKILEDFNKIKSFNSYNDYKNTMFYVLNKLLFEENPAKDLQSIITNYCQHNLHYVFHLFNTEEIKNLKKHAKNLNEILYTQISKIIDEYVICISYSNSNERNTTKKLNKFLKEFSIRSTLNSELFFKELFENSKYGEQQNYLKDNIGFLAIEENITNKSFLDYIKNLNEMFPQLNFKIFYFFEHQKLQAEQNFKFLKNKTETILPNNIEDITNNIEIWIQNYNLSYYAKKLNDVILNNYKNIYSIFFDKEKYEEEFLKYKNKQMIETHNPSNIKDIIKQNFILPNTSYYKFCQTLKEEIDIEKLKTLHTKNQIGFFAFEENLTKEFIKNILEMYVNFNEFKFVIFYFEEKQKKQFENVFINILNRVIFITPTDIYELAENIETWVQASIKNQNYLFNKIYDIFNNYSGYIYSLIFKEVNYKWDCNNYMENFYQENLNEIQFIKSLNQPIDEEKIRIMYYPNSIGFLATEENLEDLEFVQYIKDLIIKFPNTNFKGFCFNNIQKELFKNIFSEFQNINYLVVKDIYDLIASIEIYIFDFNDLRDRKIMNIIGKYCNNILYLNTHLKLNFKDMTLKDLDYKFKLNKDLVYTNPILLGFSNEEIKNSNDSYHKLVYTEIFKTLNLNPIELSYNAFQFHSIDTIKFSLNYKKFKNYFINLKQNKIKLS